MDNVEAINPPVSKGKVLRKFEELKTMLDSFQCGGSDSIKEVVENCIGLVRKADEDFIQQLNYWLTHKYKISADRVIRYVKMSECKSVRYDSNTKSLIDDRVKPSRETLPTKYYSVDVADSWGGLIEGDSVGWYTMIFYYDNRDDTWNHLEIDAIHNYSTTMTHGMESVADMVAGLL